MQYIFDVDDAKKYGLEESIVLYNMKFWISKNKANGTHFYDEHTWTYNSVTAFKLLFPFWTEKQITRILKSLINKGVLITGNYNKIAYDRTLWYAFKDESILPNGQMEKTKRVNQYDQTGKPIPDVNTDSKPNKKHIDDNTEYDKKVFLIGNYFWKKVEKPSRLNHLEEIPKNWLKPIDKLLNIDKVNSDIIFHVIDYALNDKYWKPIISSTQQLDKHFNNLELQSKKIPLSPEMKYAKNID